MRLSAYAGAILLFVIVWPLTARTDDARVFACNYTVSLTVDDQSFLVTQQSRVRDGSHIPIDAQDVRLRMRFSANGDAEVLIELILLEPSDMGWTEIYPAPLSFEATHGEPVEFSYEDDIVRIEIALIVSEQAPIPTP